MIKTYSDNLAILRPRLLEHLFNDKHIERWMKFKSIKLYVLDEKCFAFVSFIKSKGKEWCILEYIYTLPDFRRSGLGKDLIQHISKHNSNLISLCYHKENPPFFKSCGFEDNTQGEWIKCS